MLPSRFLPRYNASMGLPDHREVGRVFGLILMALAVFSACSSNAPRYPEDHARFERIVEAVNTLQRAYVQHDAGAINDLLLPLEDLQTWAAAVQRDFETYPTIVLDLSIDRIFIKGDRIATYISWQGEWKRANEETGTTARGHGILHWSGTHVILMTGVEGNLPFGMADRQASS